MIPRAVVRRYGARPMIDQAPQPDDDQPEFGPDALRLIGVADRAAAAIVAGEPMRRLFSSWVVIGRALWTARTAIAERHGGRAGHLGAPWRRWLSAHPGLASLQASERGHAVWLAEHEQEVIAWRDSLPPRHRDRMNHPATARLAFQRHLREAAIIGALTRKREVEHQKREDARRRADRMEKVLADLAQRFASMQTEVAGLRERVAHLEAAAMGPVMSKPAEARRASRAA
jgi:hypothetical protein